MKRNVAATLLALALLCGLTTGCGSRNDKDNNNGGNTTVTTPGENNGNSIMDDVEQGLEDAGDALTGNNGGNVQSGVPYDELLDDGRVHDTDGNLNDGENSAKTRSR
jgi:hypothetical protein